MAAQNTDKKVDLRNWISIILIVVLVIFIGWTYRSYMPKRLADVSGGDNKSDKYNFLDPARKLVDQRNLIVNFQPLRDQLDEIGKNPDVSIYFEYLDTGSNISENKDAEFFPASLLKVPVAMAAIKKVESGKWKWENDLVVMASDKDSRFGDLYQTATGTPMSIKDLVSTMLTKSDNTADNVLIRNLEPAEIQDVYDHLGLTGFIQENGKISAKRYSVIFRALYESSYLDEQDSQFILQALSDTGFDDYLQSGLPKGVVFAHKIGTNNEKQVYLDSGIVYAPGRPFLLTIMINNPDEEAAKKIMQDVSQKVYSYVSSAVND